MEKPAQNIQDSFLNTARKERLVLTIYLLSGVKLTGRIRSFDKYCLLLESGNQEQMVFKHAISTIAAQRPAQRESGERHAHAPVPRPREEREEEDAVTAAAGTAAGGGQ